MAGIFTWALARILLRFTGFHGRRDGIESELLPGDAIVAYGQNSSIPTGSVTVTCSPFNGDDSAVFMYRGKEVDGYLTGYNTSSLPSGVRWGDFHFEIPGLSRPAYGQWIQVTPSAKADVKEVFDLVGEGVDNGTITPHELEAIVELIKAATSS